MSASEKINLLDAVKTPGLYHWINGIHDHHFILSIDGKIFSRGLLICKLAGDKSVYVSVKDVPIVLIDDAVEYFTKDIKYRPDNLYDYLNL